MKRTLCLSFTLLLVMFGVSVRDSLAASVVVSWDANSESDLSGYLVSYGSNPGQYSNTVDVGNRTQWSITGLSGTSRVYVAVRAYNASGLTSPFSVEVVADFSGNQPPSIDDPGTQRSAPGAPALVQLKATDPEGTPVRYSAAGLPPGLRIDETSGLVSGTVRGHGYTRRAGYTVTLSASDVAGATASRTFEWFVDSAQLNDQPIRIIDLNADGRDDVFFYREETGEWSAAVSRAGGFTVRKGRADGWPDRGGMDGERRRLQRRRIQRPVALSPGGRPLVRLRVVPSGPLAHDARSVAGEHERWRHALRQRPPR
jgi:hypothetical protein